MLALTRRAFRRPIASGGAAGTQRSSLAEPGFDFRCIVKHIALLTVVADFRHAVHARRPSPARAGVLRTSADRG